ncbi:MAG: hypothetical protein HMLKMBBP_00982 [Planctomycetes bacterium]|nr:hypothetical protein [Planctomycetota bacterium]
MIRASMSITCRRNSRAVSDAPVARIAATVAATKSVDDPPIPDPAGTPLRVRTSNPPGPANASATSRWSGSDRSVPSDARSACRADMRRSSAASTKDPSSRARTRAFARRSTARFTVTAPGSIRQIGQMSTVPPARSIRAGASASCAGPPPRVFRIAGI